MPQKNVPVLRVEERTPEIVWLESELNEGRRRYREFVSLEPVPTDWHYPINVPIRTIRQEAEHRSIQTWIEISVKIAWITDKPYAEPSRQVLISYGYYKVLNWYEWSTNTILT